MFPNPDWNTFLLSRKLQKMVLYLCSCLILYLIVGQLYRLSDLHIIDLENWNIYLVHHRFPNLLVYQDKYCWQDPRLKVFHRRKQSLGIEEYPDWSTNLWLRRPHLRGPSPRRYSLSYQALQVSHYRRSNLRTSLSQIWKICLLTLCILRKTVLYPHKCLILCLSFRQLRTAPNQHKPRQFRCKTCPESCKLQALSGRMC